MDRIIPVIITAYPGFATGKVDIFALHLMPLWMMTIFITFLIKYHTFSKSKAIVKNFFRLYINAETRQKQKKIAFLEFFYKKFFKIYKFFTELNSIFIKETRRFIKNGSKKQL